METDPASAAARQVARLSWRCRRGCRELDLLLQAYLSRCFAAAPETERRQFEQLLELPDDRLQDLLLGGSEGSTLEWADLAAKIRSVSPL